jgi:hypothetical protein
MEKKEREWLIRFIEFADLISERIWDWYIPSDNPNFHKIDIELIESLPDKITKKRWFWEMLTYVGNMDIVRHFNDHKWAWHILSDLPTLDSKTITDFPDGDWIWNKISRKPHLAEVLIHVFPDKDWDWDYLSGTLILSIDLINKPIPWNFDNMSYNPSLSVSIIKEFSNQEWNWCRISYSIKDVMGFIDTFINEKNGKIDWYEVSRNPHLDFFVIEEWPNENWDWCWITKHKNIVPLDTDKLRIFLRKYGNLNWVNFEWWILSSHPGLTDDIVLENLDKPWDYQKIGISNNALTERLIGKIPDRNWNWWKMSERPDEFVNLIIQFPQKNWDWFNIRRYIKNPRKIIKYYSNNKTTFKELSLNKYLDINFVVEIPDFPWDWGELTNNDKLTLEIILLFIDKPWDMKVISGRNDLTITFIKKIIKKSKNVDWKILSKNPCLTLEMLKEFKEKSWDYDLMSENPGLSRHILEEYPTEAWNFYKISENYAVGIDIIKTLPKKLLNWKAISERIDMESVLNNPDLPWDYDGMSGNPNLETKIVNARLDEDWNLEKLSGIIIPPIDLVKKFPDDVHWNMIEIIGFDHKYDREKYVMDIE